MMTPETNRHGEMFMVSDRLMLVEQMESIGVDGLTIGREGREPAVHVTFSGRINKSVEQSDVTVALSPRDALELVNMLLHTLDAFTGGRNGAPS
jgi:hypothetical protein